MASEEREPSVQKRGEALLSRYGGEKGPTGHASAGESGEPVSLGTFMGGKAQGARLGTLSGGDGRTFSGDSDDLAYQRLPGMAAPEGSLASFLEKRQQELFPDEAKRRADSAPRQGDEPQRTLAGAALTDEPAEAADAPAKPTASATPAPAPREDVADAPPADALPRRSTTGRRMVVLISGSGSNLQALIDATMHENAVISDAQIVKVISNRMKAYGLQRAKNVSPAIPTQVLSLKTYLNRNPGHQREDYDLELARRVLGDDEPLPDLVVLAGFMHIVSETFLSALGHETSLAQPPAFDKRPARPVPIINLHPALPGAFDGAGAIERAYEAFQQGKISETGVMVHEVVAEVDRGAPIIVRKIPIHQGESLDDLETRMHSVEHEIIVEAAAKVLAGHAGPNATAAPKAPSAAEGRVSEPSTATELKKAPAPKTASKSETAPAPKTAPKSETASEPKTAPKSETAPAPKTAPKSETASEPKTASEPSAAAEPRAALASATEPLPTTLLRWDAPSKQWQPLPAPVMLYDTDLLWVRGPSPFLWAGHQAPSLDSLSTSDKAELATVPRVSQGAEPPTFLQTIGGLMSTSRGGPSAHSAEHRLFTVRSVGDAVCIDEIPFCPRYVSDAMSAVASTPNGVLVWHGSGSDDAQQRNAATWAAWLERTYKTVDTAAFFQLWGDTSAHARGWHHRRRLELAPDERAALVYAPADAPSPAPFTLAALRDDVVAVVDARLELYVVVGAKAHSQRAAIAAAFNRAEQLAAQRHGVPMRPPVHVLWLPSLPPLDLLALARDYWNAPVFEQGAAPTRAVLMHLQSVAAARAKLRGE